MNSAEQVDVLISNLKASGRPLQEVAWEAGLACEGWAYVFGAKGEYCTPSKRQARYNSTKDEKHKAPIKDNCKNFSGEGSCSGCKWFPNGKKTRFFDCRGFTYWILLQVYGWTLKGAGCTSQWNKEENWTAKGTIDTIPDDVLVCLFYSKDNKEVVWEHTGFGFHGQTVECSKGVQHFKTRNRKWTHWAIPACVDSPTPTGKPTLRRGDKGAWVTLAQTELIQKGYGCGSFGADGEFGKATEAAVKAFQRDHTDQDGNPLTVDGVIGQKTWWALDETETILYTVTVPHLTKSQADALTKQYPGSTETEERG